MESFSRPPPARGGDCAGPEASWGHRKNNLLRSQDELFYGYYLPAAIMMRGENGPAVPEFARRATLSSCRHDPVRTLVPVLTAMIAAGIPLGDVLADSGYAHRDAAAWALPLRAAGAQLVQDLHPHDRRHQDHPELPGRITRARGRVPAGLSPRPQRAWRRSGRYMLCHGISTVVAQQREAVISRNGTSAIFGPIPISSTRNVSIARQQ